MYENPMWISGHIEPDSFYEAVTGRFADLMMKTKSGEPLTVFVNSGGGETHTALGLYDLIHECDRETIGVVSGTAQSGGSIILQACRRRIVTRHSTLMLHRSKVGIGRNGGASIEDAQSAVDTFRRMDERFYAIYAERTGKSVDTIRQMARQDTYFDAEESVSFGLADDVLDEAILYGHKPELVRLLLKPVDNLELSLRGTRCLANADIKLVGELVQMNEADVLMVQNLGRTTLNDIKAALRELGLYLGMHLDDNLHRRIVAARS